MPRIAAHAVAFLAVSIALSTFAPAAHAWPAEGLVFGAREVEQEAMLVLRDSLGGARIVYTYRTGEEGEYRCIKAQSIAANGTIAAGWPDSGLAVTCGSTPTALVGPAGDLWIAHGDFYVVKLRHLLASGALDPAFPADGVAIDTVSGPEPVTQIALDGEGGIYCAWNSTTSRIRLARFTASGAPSPGWPAGGVLVTAGSNSFEGFRMVSDGEGGAIVLWFAGRVTAQRFGPDGHRHPAWPEHGLELNARPPNGGYLTLQRLVASTPGHFLAAFEDVEPNGQYDARAARFSKLGVLDPAWPQGGALFATSLTRFTNVDATEDGEGGLFVSWNAGAGPRVQRIALDGSRSLGWPAAGVPMTAAGTSPSARALLAPAGEGALVTAWVEASNVYATIVRQQWIGPGGIVDPTQPAPGRDVSGVDTLALLRAVTPDGAGGAFIGWTRYTSAFFDRAEPLLARPVTPFPLAAPEAGAPRTLALAPPVPNPARDAFLVRFALPRDTGARLELVDLAGRRVRAIAARGAGEHAERFESLDRLPAGLYFLRLVQDGAASVRRIAIVH